MTTNCYSSFQPYPNNDRDRYNLNQNDELYYQQNPYDVQNDRRNRVETERLKQILIEIDKKSNAECTLNVAAQWNYETNVNPDTQLAAVSTKKINHSH